MKFVRAENNNNSILLYPSHGFFPGKDSNDQYTYARIKPAADGTYTKHNGLHSSTNSAVDFGNNIVAQFVDNIYSFRAERFNNGICAVGNSMHLKPNAENLAEALSNLQSNRYRYERYNSAVQRVLPQIKWISVNNIENNRLGNTCMGPPAAN